MGGKPRPKKLTYKQMAEKLAGLAMFAINHLDVPKGEGILINLETGVARRWEEDFFDVLASCGNEYNREKYYAEKSKGKRKK